jgi:hypothetical protein
MSSLSYAIITPSYWKDLECCELLINSADHWVAKDVKHYLVIANRDVKLFRPVMNSRTELIVVEDIIPSWLFRVPGFKRFWMSLRTRPVKNWILQQIVKLSVPSVVKEEVLLYADSDMFFVAPYNPRSFERDGKVPLFLETGQRGLISTNDPWQAVASRLLGLPIEKNCDNNYINQLICWRRDHALAMLERVNQTTGKQWPLSVAPLSGFSEYILYGVHAVRVLGEKSGHWNDGLIRTHNHWQELPLDIPALEKFRSELQPHHHSAMISAKSGTSVADIRKVFLQ